MKHLYFTTPEKSAQALMLRMIMSKQLCFQRVKPTSTLLQLDLKAHRCIEIGCADYGQTFVENNSYI